MRPAYRPAMAVQPSDTVLVVDLGSLVTRLIARRVREAGVYCEIAPFNAAAAAFERLQDFFIALRVLPDGFRFRASVAEPQPYPGSPPMPDSHQRLGRNISHTALEAIMQYPIPSLVLILSMVAVPAVAQAPTDAQCSASATQATGYTPGTPSTSGPDGSRVAGAAKGAAVGAAVGGAQGNQYENAPDAMQDKHREDQAKSGAAAGMAVAGSRNRQERRGERRSADDQQAAWQSSYDACMASAK